MDKKCNHRIKSKNTTIKLLPGLHTFTYPEHIYGVCECCGKSFHYIKYSDGILKKYKNKEEI